MANVKKSDRVSDTDIKRLNHIGLGLKAIADELGCHPATITLRLKAMDINATDTRRSFMEGVYAELTTDQQEWLSHNLFNAEIPVKVFIARLITEAFEGQTKGKAATAAAVVPAAMPEMETRSTKPPEPPAPDELTLGEYEVGGVSERPDPAQTVEPERLFDQKEAAPESLPEPVKRLFGT